MDAKYLQEIKARTAQELTEDDYHSLKIADIAKIRMDSKRLVAEVERLTVENSTLKRAIEIAKRGYVDCMGAERQKDGKCLGYGHSGQDDEPCEQCKVCSINSAYEDVF